MTATTNLPTGGAKRQILDFLGEQRRATPQALQDRFRALANAQGKGVPVWLSKHLAELRAMGFVEREQDAHGNTRYWMLTDQDDEHDSESAPNVATPRRISMFGPVYVPPAPNHRPGAMDYANCASIINGQARPFRGTR